MASSFFYTVHHPRDVKETYDQNLPNGLVVIDLTITNLRKYIRHDSRSGTFIDDELHPFHSRNSQETISFHLNVMRRRVDFYEQQLVPVLNRVGIDTEYFDVHNVVNDIIVLGFQGSYLLKPNWETRVPIVAEFVGNFVVHLNNNNNYENDEDWIEYYLVDRALLESELDFEANNYGMVPADQSSVKMMVTNVNMEFEGEDCMICLEELEFGMVASRMPCSHTFHGNCIQNWLEKSHYCPLCRFEMPTLLDRVEEL